MHPQKSGANWLPIEWLSAVYPIIWVLQKHLSLSLRLRNAGLRNQDSCLRALSQARGRSCCSLDVILELLNGDLAVLQMPFLVTDLSTNSVFGSIITMPPRKFVNAFANASTVSTSR